MRTLFTSMAHVVILRAELAAVEADLDRVDDIGDAAAVARVRRQLEPRIAWLREAIASAEVNSTEVQG